MKGDTEKTSQNFFPQIKRQFSIDRVVVVDWNCKIERWLSSQNSIRNSQIQFSLVIDDDDDDDDARKFEFNDDI